MSGKRLEGVCKVSQRRLECVLKASGKHHVGTGQFRTGHVRTAQVGTGQVQSGIGQAVFWILFEVFLGGV